MVSWCVTNEERRYVAYLAHICAGLADLGEELEACHPFFMAKSGFSGEVVEVLCQPFEDVFQSRVWTLTVDQLDIVGDVVYVEIFEHRHIDLWRVGRRHSEWLAVTRPKRYGPSSKEKRSRYECDTVT